MNNTILRLNYLKNLYQPDTLLNMKLSIGIIRKELGIFYFLAHHSSRLHTEPELYWMGMKWGGYFPLNLDLDLS